MTAQAPTSANDDVTYGLAYNAAGQVRSRTISRAAYVWNGAYVVDRPYGTDGLNRVVDAGTSGQSGYTVFGYDGRGNLLCTASTAPACTSPTVKYKYDAENHLRGTVAGAALVYDPLGRLYSSTTVGGTVTRYLYDGVNLIGEYDASSSVPLRRYVFGAGTDEPLARYTSGGTTPEWLLADHQGSIIAALDSTGAVTAKNTYDEYGLPGSGNVGLFQYTGQVYLADLSLYHYKARAYSPTLGRFLQTDPTGYDDGLNWYAYVGNDPLNGNDPSGTQEAAPHRETQEEFEERWRGVKCLANPNSCRGRSAANDNEESGSSSGGIFGSILKGLGFVGAATNAAEMVYDSGRAMGAMDELERSAT